MTKPDPGLVRTNWLVERGTEVSRSSTVLPGRAVDLLVEFGQSVWSAARSARGRLLPGREERASGDGVDHAAVDPQRGPGCGGCLGQRDIDDHARDHGRGCGAPDDRARPVLLHESLVGQSEIAVADADSFWVAADRCRRGAAPTVAAMPLI